MFMLDNKALPVDTAFTHNEIQYPNNWLRLASQEERAAIGITEVADPEIYDDRFYWGVGNPKDIDMVKAMLTSQVKQTAGSLLSPTDWKITRFIETAAPVGAEVTAYREAVRAASNANETAINACVTTFEIESLQLTWPEL